MKLNKYNPRGIIQRNGTVAMSWQTWFVVAMNIKEERAERPTHAGRCHQPDIPATSWVSDFNTSSPLGSLTNLTRDRPHIVQRPAKTQKPIIQNRPIDLSSMYGSKTKGNEPKAISEPRLESENNR
jgi:hypothetical protein